MGKVMIGRMAEYVIKLAVELIVYLTVSVASVCLPLFSLLRAAHLIQLPNPTLLTFCPTNIHAARIFQKSCAFKVQQPLSHFMTLG